MDHLPAFISGLPLSLASTSAKAGCAKFHRSLIPATRPARVNVTALAATRPDAGDDHVRIRKLPTLQGAPVIVGVVEWSVAEMAEKPSNLIEEIVWKIDETTDRSREKASFLALMSKLRNLPPEEEARGPQLLQSILARPAGSHPRVILGDPRKPSVPTLEPNGPEAKLEKLATEAAKVVDKWMQAISNARALGEEILAIAVRMDRRFGGLSQEQMSEIRKACAQQVPVICADIIASVYQIAEAKLRGADAIIMMTAVFPRKDLEYFLKIAKALNLLAILEVHNRKELDLVLSFPETSCILLGERDLNTLTGSVVSYIEMYRSYSDILRDRNIAVLAEGLQSEIDSLPKEFIPHAAIVLDH